MRRILLALALVLGWAGCASRAPIVEAPTTTEPPLESPPARVWSMPVTLPVTIGLRVDDAFTEDEIDDLQWAERAWTKATGGCVRFAFGGDVEVTRAATSADLPAGHHDGDVAIWMASEARLWLPGPSICPMPEWCHVARATVYVHELAHVLGLEHDETPGSCMHAYAAWECAIAGVPDVDARAFCAAYGGCVCSGAM